MTIRAIILGGILLYVPALACAQFEEVAKSLGLDKNSEMSESKIASGLKEALRVGANNSVKLTGTTNGYFRNQAIKISYQKTSNRRRRCLVQWGISRKLMPLFSA
ncbi:MAG: hypothetical protein QOD84_1351 [Acidobacteriaceae bacterium]|jgi:hypothetical protein